MPLTINHRPCVIAECDGCHMVFDQDEGPVHFDSFTQGADTLRESGWLVRPDALLCRSCAEPQDPPPLPEDVLIEACGAVQIPWIDNGSGHG